jgi:hypothetical protein
LIEKQAERSVLKKQLKEREDEQKLWEDLLKKRENAHQIIQLAAQLTQESLQEQLCSVVTMALSSVFEDPYEFVVEFVAKRNSTECNLMFQREGERCSPLDDSGYGAADIASISLRISFRDADDTRPVLLMDEPCKNISKDYKTLTAIMLKEICKKLGLQMIVVSHIPEFREGADQLFMITMDNQGVSHCSTNQ